MPGNIVMTNRAPVLTLWAAVVAERLGYQPEEALSLAKAMAGLTAQTKGRMLGIFGTPKGPDGGPPKKTGLGEEFWVPLLGRSVPAIRTEQGVRAVNKDEPVEPAKVEKYLKTKFGEDLTAVREAMVELACAYEPGALAEAAYPLYERFRPKVSSGEKGWGQKAELDLDRIRGLAPKKR